MTHPQQLSESSLFRIKCLNPWQISADSAETVLNSCDPVIPKLQYVQDFIQVDVSYHFGWDKRCWINVRSFSSSYSQPPLVYSQANLHLISSETPVSLQNESFASHASWGGRGMVHHISSVETNVAWYTLFVIMFSVLWYRSRVQLTVECVCWSCSASSLARILFMYIATSRMSKGATHRGTTITATTVPPKRICGGQCQIYLYIT